MHLISQMPANQWLHDPLPTVPIIVNFMAKKRRRDFDDDLMPSDFIDPWPPLSDEEIEERERQADWEDLNASIPDARERNRRLR